MGWCSSTEWYSKQQLVKYLSHPSRFGDNTEHIKSSVVGNNHWYIAKQISSGEVWIGLDLMASHGDDGWAYKDLTASCGPVEVNCPITFLKMASAPVPGSYDEAWRKRVLAYHERKRERRKRNYVKGMIVHYGGSNYQLVMPAGSRRGWIVNRCSDNLEFRMNALQLSRSEIRETAH